MEIVVVSDTVRQRRSRTPISPNSFEGFGANGDMSSPPMMPDLLPHVPTDNHISDESSKKIHLRDENENIESGSVKTDTIDVFESVKRFMPEQVETVHIVDASSDSDASTPHLPRKQVKLLGSIDELQSELDQELESVAEFDSRQPSLIVKKEKISFGRHAALHDDDRDLLADDSEPTSVKNLKIRRTLKEIWMEERVNSFYSPENDNDEPVVFSDDEEIPRYSVEMDSDSDVVA